MSLPKLQRNGGGMRNRWSALSIGLSLIFAVAVANFARLSVQAMSKQIQVNVARAQTRAVTEATRVEADARVTVRATVVTVPDATFTTERPPSPDLSVIPLSSIEAIPITIMPTPTAAPTEQPADPTLTAVFYADVFRALSGRTETSTPEPTHTPTPIAIPTPSPTDDYVFVDPTLAVILITPLIPTDTYEPTLTLTIEPTFTSTPLPPTAPYIPTETATSEPTPTATSSPLDSPLPTPTMAATAIETETPAP